MERSDWCFYRRDLPHLRVRGAVYFVTYRLREGQPPLSPAERDLILESLRFFDGDRYELDRAVVMDDHVHVLVTPLGRFELEKILHTWKSFTSHQMVLQFGRASPVWLHESFDHVIRSEQELRRKQAYIEDNPHRKWPGITDYKWLYVRG